PRLQKRKETDRPSGGVRTIATKKNTKETVEKSDSDSKSAANVAVVKTPITLFESEEDLWIEVIRKGESEVASASKADKSLPPAAVVRKTVSANDVSKDGVAVSLEFKSVGRNDIKKDDGLYVFSAAVKAMEK